MKYEELWAVKPLWSLWAILVVFSTSQVQAQETSSKRYTRYDTLMGAITEERSWWDLLKYDLQVTIHPETQSISGSNTIHYQTITSGEVMQIDLQSPMTIQAVHQDGKALAFTRDSAFYFIRLPKKQRPGTVSTLNIAFTGKPHVAKNPPWDGGFVWSKDKNKKYFIATACQGIGASIWWPCKDHPYDEPDQGMTIAVNVPKDLVAVANGRLVGEKEEAHHTKTYIWQVVNPINNYGVNVNVGDYVHFSEKYKGEKGVLDMDYWVLRYNQAKAKRQFKEALRVMEAFEYWFGPYPFYEDSYKLVETPYLGMEHQSSVTYGNGYRNGYLGEDLSDTGWGHEFDFIIVHESGHEWFANNITHSDVADMWIHEAFTTYSEALFLEYFYSKQAAAEYVRGRRTSIQNQRPMVGEYGIHQKTVGDIYTKGANLLHTLRQIVADDKKWRAMLRGINQKFYHQTVSSKEVEEYMSDFLGLKLKPFFDQYLRDIRVPTFEYRISNSGELVYRWVNCIDGFDMPIRVSLDGKSEWLYPTTEPQMKDISSADTVLKVDPDFYVYTHASL